jgi:beta-mannosidase
VIYWSNNKGGPLFQFGCIDYGGYPMMPYYAVKRVFAPVAVHVYREVSDIVVMLSNQSAEAAELRVELSHLGKGGTVLKNWTEELRISPGALLRVRRLEELYAEVRERTEELIYAAVFREGRLVSDDMLFFCPFSEYEGEYRPLRLRAEKTGDETWRLHIEAESPARLVELESGHKLLYSDNYFPLVPGTGKTVEVSVLERTGTGPLRIEAGILGAPELRRIELD